MDRLVVMFGITNATAATVTEDAVKRRYRQLAITCHPDRFPDDPRAASEFHALTEASNALIAHIRRRDQGTTAANDEKRKWLAEDERRRRPFSTLIVLESLLQQPAAAMAFLAAPTPSLRSERKSTHETSGAAAAAALKHKREASSNTSTTSALRTVGSTLRDLFDWNDLQRRPAECLVIVFSIAVAFVAPMLFRVA